MLYIYVKMFMYKIILRNKKLLISMFDDIVNICICICICVYLLFKYLYN